MTRTDRLAVQSLLFLALGVLGLLGAAPASARQATRSPLLVVSDDPLPPGLGTNIYGKPNRAPATRPEEVMNPDYYSDMPETPAGRKVDTLRADLFSLQNDVAELSQQLKVLQDRGQSRAATYYASVATIQTQLQSGTTPGNPRLVNYLGRARSNLELLANNADDLNGLAMNLSEAAATSQFMLESVRAAYGLSGSIEEDHIRLAQLEDTVTNTAVMVDRLLTSTNDDIARTVSYLSTERDNMRTLSMAVTTGDLFGGSLMGKTFMKAQPVAFTSPARKNMPEDLMPSVLPEAGSRAPTVPPAPRPLVKIRFDRPDVAYQQPVYMAVKKALSRYPDAQFRLIAVHPEAGNAARIAIESTKARRNAEKVLRNLSEMGIDPGRVDLAYKPDPDAASGEVHLYME